jgi:hypothetical protein
MSFFSRFIDSPKNRKMTRLLTDTLKTVEKEHKPMSDLGMAIIKASVNCRDALKNQIKAPTEGVRLEREAYVLYEFIYFYMHMTMRCAQPVLNKSQMEKLQSFLGPSISKTAIDSYFLHWPDDLKGKMINEFYEKLNETELEYTNCTKFNTAEQGEEKQKQMFRALFITLGKYVEPILSGDENVDVMTTVLLIPRIAMIEYGKMKLNKLIAKIHVVA